MCQSVSLSPLFFFFWGGFFSSNVRKESSVSKHNFLLLLLVWRSSMWLTWRVAPVPNSANIPRVMEVMGKKWTSCTEYENSLSSFLLNSILLHTAAQAGRCCCFLVIVITTVQVVLETSSAFCFVLFTQRRIDLDLFACVVSPNCTHDYPLVYFAL